MSGDEGGIKNLGHRDWEGSATWKGGMFIGLGHQPLTEVGLNLEWVF